MTVQQVIAIVREQLEALEAQYRQARQNGDIDTCNALNNTIRKAAQKYAELCASR